MYETTYIALWFSSQGRWHLHVTKKEKGHSSDQVVLMYVETGNIYLTNMTYITSWMEFYAISNDLDLVSGLTNYK